MLNIDKLTEMVTDYKIVECADTYEELIENWQVSKKLFKYIKRAKNNNVAFDTLRKEICEIYEEMILTYLKGNI